MLVRITTGGTVGRDGVGESSRVFFGWEREREVDIEATARNIGTVNLHTRREQVEKLEPTTLLDSKWVELIERVSSVWSI